MQREILAELRQGSRIGVDRRQPQRAGGLVLHGENHRRMRFARAERPAQAGPGRFEGGSAIEFGPVLDGVHRAGRDRGEIEPVRVCGAEEAVGEQVAAALAADRFELPGGGEVVGPRLPVGALAPDHPGMSRTLHDVAAGENGPRGVGSCRERLGPAFPAAEDGAVDTADRLGGDGVRDRTVGSADALAHDEAQQFAPGSGRDGDGILQ